MRGVEREVAAVFRTLIDCIIRLEIHHTPHFNFIYGKFVKCDISFDTWK